MSREPTIEGTSAERRAPPAAEPRSGAGTAADQGPGFEALYSALEDVARQLEAGNIGLAESIGLYERGAELVEQLRAILEAAEARVQQVRARMDARTGGGPAGGGR